MIKTFWSWKNYVKGFTKACTLRNSIVDVHCNNICLKKWPQILTKSDFFSSIFGRHNELPFKFVYDLRDNLNFLYINNFYKTHTSFNCYLIIIQVPTSNYRKVSHITFCLILGSLIITLYQQFSVHFHCFCMQMPS